MQHLHGKYRTCQPVVNWGRFIQAPNPVGTIFDSCQIAEYQSERLGSNFQGYRPPRNYAGIISDIAISCRVVIMV